MKRGSFLMGFFTCLLLASVTTTAYAAGIMAERSQHRILVDGTEVQMGDLHQLFWYPVPDQICW